MARQRLFVAQGCIRRLRAVNDGLDVLLVGVGARRNIGRPVGRCLYRDVGRRRRGIGAGSDRLGPDGGGCDREPQQQRADGNSSSVPTASRAGRACWRNVLRQAGDRRLRGNRRNRRNINPISLVVLHRHVRGYLRLFLNQVLVANPG